MFLWIDSTGKEWWNKICKAWNTVQEWLSDAFAFIIVAWNKLVEGCKKGWKKLKGWWNSCVKFFTDIFTKIMVWWDNLGRRWRILKFKVKKAFNSIVDSLVEGWENLKKRLTEGWENVKKAFTDEWEAFKKAFTDWDSFKQYISESWESIKIMVADGWTSFVNKFYEFRDNFPQILNTVFDKINEFFGGKLYEMGDAIMRTCAKIPVLNKILGIEGLNDETKEAGRAFTQQQAMAAVELAVSDKLSSVERRKCRQTKGSDT